jgi:hypothetical protein
MKESSLCGGIAAVVPACRAQATTMCATVLTIAAVALEVPQARAANTFLVTTAGDPGPMGTLSLRQAIAFANVNGGDTVQFDASLNGSTITLQSGEIPISKDTITIQGPGPDKLTVSGNGTSRIFNVAVGYYLAFTKIYGLTLTHGNAGTALFGGAIAASNSYLFLKDVRITQSAAQYGGALSLLDAGARLTNCVIVGNSANQTGGGISFVSVNMVHSDVLNVYNSTIGGNSSGSGGGGIIFSVGNDIPVGLKIRYSTISGNRTDASGGGLLLSKPVGNAEILSSTIAQNYASVGGGGVSILYGQTYVGWSTVAGNSTQAGVGNGLDIHAMATLNLQSTIIANNVSDANSSDFSGNFHADYSLLKNIGQSIVTGSNNLIGFDPKLGTLADHGGPTTTMVPSSSSPVIGAGKTTGGLATDQRGLARAFGTDRDIGAVELQQPEDVIFGSDFSFCTEVQKC